MEALKFLSKVNATLHGHGHDTDTDAGIRQFLKNKDTTRCGHDN